MLDPIIMFFERLFLSIGRGFGRLVAWILWPFLTIAYWYRQRGWVIKLPIGLAVIGLVLFYGHFIWMTQAWTNFDPKFVDAYKYTERGSSAGTQLTGVLPVNAVQDSSEKVGSLYGGQWPLQQHSREARQLRRPDSGAREPLHTVAICCVM